VTTTKSIMAALYCTLFHCDLDKLHIYDSCTVTFVEQPSFDSLDTYENKWLSIFYRTN